MVRLRIRRKRSVLKEHEQPSHNCGHRQRDRRHGGRAEAIVVHDVISYDGDVGRQDISVSPSLSSVSRRTVLRRTVLRRTVPRQTPSCISLVVRWTQTMSPLDSGTIAKVFSTLVTRLQRLHHHLPWTPNWSPGVHREAWPSESLPS